MKWEPEESSYLRMTSFLSKCKCVLDNVLKSVYQNVCVSDISRVDMLPHTHTHTLAHSGVVLQWADREKLMISI